MKIIIGTTNKEKLVELRGYCNVNYPEYEQVAIGEFDIEFDDVEEGEDSYKDNAVKKVLEYKYQLRKAGLFGEDDLLLTEDSGLEGINTSYPGVVSKREIERLGVVGVIKELLSRNQGTDEVFYISFLVVVTFDNKFDVRFAKEYGKILQEPVGIYNFPFDKHFLSNERGYLGNLTPEEIANTTFRLKAVPYKKEI